MVIKGNFLNRRNLLLSLTSAGLVSVLGVKWLEMIISDSKADSIAKTGHIVLGGKYRSSVSSSIKNLPFDFFDQNFIFKMDLLNKSFEEIRTKTPTHSLQQHPSERSLFACTSRQSDRISLFDWESKKELAYYVASDSHYFRGHSAFSIDGKLLLTTGIFLSKNGKSQEGVVSVFEIPKLKLKDQIFLGKFTNHDLQGLGSDKFVTGLSSNVAGVIQFGILDLNERAFRSFSRTVSGSDKILTTHHLKIHKSTVFGLANQSTLEGYKLGGLFSFDASTSEIQQEFPFGSSKCNSELLSIEFDPETNYVWLTVPSQNSIVVWDIKNDELVSVIDSCKYPTSIIKALGVDAIMVGAADGFRAFDRQTLKPLEQYENLLSSLKLRGYAAPHTAIHF